MTQPVDLTNLRSMTDGDVEMEKVLFEEFCSSFDDGVISLQNSLGVESSESWRKQAHSLKGISLNLGAMHLGELCKKAQDGCNEDKTNKEELLNKITSEYQQVKNFLLSLH